MSPPFEAARPRRDVPGFLFALVCVLLGLLLPSRGIGPVYVRAHAALANAVLVPNQPEGGVGLRVLATREQLELKPWTATLMVSPPGAQPVLVPVDLRGLAFLPSASFIALCVATPLGGWRKNARLLLLGLALLQPLLWLLLVTPLLSFLGGTGPVTAFQLGRGTHTVLQIVYRALVAPPGMAFALPLLLWWVLLRRAGGIVWDSENRTALSDFRWPRGRAGKNPR